MQFYFYLAVIFSLVVAVFAIQNSQLIAIKLFFWQLPEFPLAVIILGAALAGAVAAFLFGLTNSLKSLKLRKELKEQVKSLEEELVKSKEAPKEVPHAEPKETEVGTNQPQQTNNA
ncbi:LapA family protein [Zhaonella formicivorans]|uniref:LapA family protein n=1 Tax=Zhaonella formicivorans TaxID=2528593 RepID=UPI001D106D9B|nr:LapA family protein [Zhaonella formicivorans]